MALERLEFGVRVRKFMVISVKTCYRSVWNHPILVGLVCFLIFLYRSFPLLFSVLVTASPVLVCTAVLLGALLSFGSPNIPEIDEKEEEKVSHEVSPLKTGATEDDTVIKRDVGDDGFVVERHVGKRWDIVENADEKVSLVDNEVSEIEEDDGSVCYTPLVNEDLDSRDIRCENGVIDGVDGMLNDSLVEKKREIQLEMQGSEGLLSMGEAVKDQHLLANEVRDRNLEVEDGKFPAVFGDDDGDGDDDESLDSGSGGAKSSSPDASMADIILMLDELHPLLGSEAPQPAQMSHDGSDAGSERSHDSSNDESVESDESENQGEEDNDNEEDEGEGEGTKGDKEDESKSAIKWTEDDQKNLMDLGTLELERNQRLENLIARRRARKSMSFMAEKNLIDLDSADIPLNITPISTTRRNPFELPYVSYDDLGLPPIPGSAPPNLQPKRNPFDLPYDSGEEKPDLKGDSFQEEFSGFNQRETVSQREAFFRRHESFNVGPSSLGVPRQELKWKPYFVPERFVTEGASPSSFQRQSSEVSESKLSSVPDTESASSVVDEEDNKPNELDVSQETELNLNEDHASVRDEQESQSSGDVDHAKNRNVHHDMVEITLGDGESQLEMESNLSEYGATTHVELDAYEIHPRTEPVEEGYSSRSSLSSLSEIDEKISDVKGEGSAGFEPRDHEIKESGISTQPSFEESELHFTSRVVDDNQRREPVYDSSPPSIENFLSFSSVNGNEPRARDLPENGEHGVTYAGSSGVSSTSAVHIVSMVPESVAEYVSTNAGSSSLYEGLKEDVPNKEESFTPNQVDLSSLGAETTVAVDQEIGEVLDSSPEEQQHPIHHNKSSEAEPVDRCAVDKKDTQLEQDEIHLSSSPEDNLIEGSVMPNGEIIQTECDQMHSPNSDASLDVDGHHDKDEELSSIALTYRNMPSNDISPSTAEEPGHVVMAQVSETQSSEANLREEHKKESEMDQVQSPCSDSNIYTGLDRGINVEEIPSDSSYLDVPSRENPSPESEKQLLWSDKPTDEPPIDEHDKLGEPSLVESESRGVLNIVNDDANIHEVHDSEDKLSTNLSSMTLESASSPFESTKHTLPTDREDLKDKILNKIESEGPKEVSEHFSYAEVYATHVNEENISEEEDEIKEIDEGILSELDTVGDFNVKEIGLSEESHVAYTESALLPEYIKTKTTVELPVLEARSVEDIDLAIKQLDEGVDVEEVILPSMIVNQQAHADANSKLPVVDARSLEDIHNAFQQGPESDPSELPHSSDLRNGSSEAERLEAISVEDVDLAYKQLGAVDVEEVILPGMIENQQDHADTNSKLPVVEAGSLEDIHNAFQQGPESNPAELPQSTDLINGSSEVEQHDVVSTKEVVSGIQENSENAAGEQKNENEETEDRKTEANVELPVLEARSVEDIELAFKQLDEGVDFEEVILPSIIQNQQDHADTNSKLPVVEARSLEDIHNAFQRGPESNPAQLPHSSGLRNGSSEVERHDAVPPKEFEVSDVVSGIQENSENAAGGPENEYEEASEKSKYQTLKV
ncbi:uncharacterized protein LOC111297963 isoform X2 [Durio zibethinus]|uniref:Uncharacterized protein LOC111297963 isoform X2 n=1 Tax=Durio zibethinus TaxID=66656 RepID=A0A6P5Z6C6_DURZI|nr:uncharacterized protein LOC111297963 isoform X2 [Durio zibethinus]